MDFNDEINSFMPENENDDFIKKFYHFHKNFLKNSKKSSIINHLIKTFDKSWSLFIFLCILNSIKKSHNFFNLKESLEEKNKIFNSGIKDSTVESQFAFWKAFDSLLFFMVVTGFQLNKSSPTKIGVLIQKSLALMCKCGILIKYKNYQEVPNDSNPSDSHLKEVHSYKIEIEFETPEIFNVSQKLFYNPPQIIDYPFPVKISLNPLKKSNFSGEVEFSLSENKKNDSKYKIAWEKRSIITGPTFIRAETYDKSNSHGYKAFEAKDKNIRKLYSDTKFYPDHAFISHLKKKYYSKLNLETIQSRMYDIRKELEKSYELANWNYNQLEKMKLLQKEYSKLLENEKTYKFLNHQWDESYHLTSSNDYRGRKYYCSPVTFTQFKLSRFCFHYGPNGNLSKPYFNWDEYKECFSGIEIEYDIKLSPAQQEVVGFYLIGMGKLDEQRKHKLETPLKDMLFIGQKMFLEKNIPFFEEIKNEWYDKTLKDKIDVIEFECYFFGLDNFLKGDMTKRIILKDATASGYQIQASIVGTKSNEKLSNLNLGKENIFTDTYIFIKESFEKTQQDGEIPDWAKIYFKRSIIKKFCMIIPYSAGFEECFKSIEEHVKKGDEKKTELIFSSFYHFIKDDLWQELNLKESYKSYIKNYLKSNENKEFNHSFFVESETAIADLSYYIKTRSDFDTKYVFIDISTGEISEPIRTTRKYQIVSVHFNKKKTLQSFSPNFTHFHDSEIIRILHAEPYNLKFASVHDAFIIPSFDCGKLVYSYGMVFKVKIRFEHKVPITSLM